MQTFFFSANCMTQTMSCNAIIYFVEIKVNSASCLLGLFLGSKSIIPFSCYVVTAKQNV